MSDCELILFRGVMEEGNRDACEGRHGCFLSERVVGKNGLSPVKSGNFGAVVHGQGKGVEMVTGNLFRKSKVLSLCERQSDAEVRRQFSEVGFHDETVLQMRDREALAQRISELEKELYQHQHHMGLLLIEKKELAAKAENLTQQLFEAQQFQKNMQAEHMAVISEFEKKEGNMQRAMDFQRQSIANLEKALNEMHAETAKIKLEYQKKMSKAHALEATVEEKYFELKGKMHSLDAKVAEVNRRSSELDRRSEDVETRWLKLSIESSSFMIEKECFEKELGHQRQVLRPLEQEVQANQENLAQWSNLLDERQMEANERDNTCRKKEKELDEAWKGLKNSNVSLKSKEEDMGMRRTDFDAKEQEALVKWQFLQNKEKKFLEIEEQLTNQERVKLEKIIDCRSSILQTKLEEFVLEADKKRRTLDEQLKRKDEVAHKDIALEDREREILKKEQFLESEMQNMKHREMENQTKINALKEAIENKKEELILERIKVEKEWELLGNRRLAFEEDLKQLYNEKGKFACQRCTEEETLKNREREILEKQQFLEREMQNMKHREEENQTKMNALRESIENEKLIQERIKLEKEWEFLSKRKLSLEEEMKQLHDEKERFAKLTFTDEETLKKENLEPSGYIQMAVEDSKLNKEICINEITQRKINSLEVFSGENVNVAKPDPCLQANQELIKDTLIEEEINFNDRSKNEGVLESVNKADQTTENIVSYDENQLEEPLKEGDYYLTPVEKLTCTTFGFKDGDDAIMSLDNPGVTDQGTFSGCVKPEACVSHMQRCSRPFQFSPNKRASDHSDMSVCIDDEPLGHIENLRPGELLRDFNVSQKAQFTSGIQCDTEPPRLNKNVDSANDSFNEILGNPDLILQLHDCLRDEDELWFPCAELKDNHRCLLPEYNSGPTQSIDKECDNRVRRRFVFVKKSRSVNALIQDNSLEEISQNKLNKYCSCKAKEIMPKRLKVGYQNDNPEDDNTGKSFHSLRHEMMITETDGESAEAHSHDVSSLVGCKELENSPGEEIPGLNRYNFRRSTIERHALTRQTKQKRAEGIDSLETKVLNMDGHDNEGAQSHTYASENL